jgi:chloramphenicol-sensitive protein RarD
LRKISGAASIPGLFIETTVILPLALVYLFHLQRTDTLHFGLSTPGLSLLLISTGIVTGLPLLWFAHAARYLRLTTVGFLQYLSPSCTFFLGIFAFHEPFRRAQVLTFSLIWIALAIFTADAVTRWRASKGGRPVPL